MVISSLSVQGVKNGPARNESKVWKTVKEKHIPKGLLWTAFGSIEVKPPPPMHRGQGGIRVLHAEDLWRGV